MNKPKSLLKSILSKISIFYVLGCASIGTFSGYLVYHSQIESFNAQIVKENILKAEKESIVFQNTVQELNSFKQTLEKELSNSDPAPQFNSYMEHLSDNSYRSNHKVSENGKNSVGFISSKSKVDSIFLNDFMKTYKLIDNIGRIKQSNYYMTWAVFNNDSNIVFCPEKPEANYKIAHSFQDTKESYWILSTNEKNPLHKGKWLPPYFDPSFDLWMISYVIPIYKNNKHLMTIGFDIKLSDVFSRILKADNQNSYNFLISSGGNLIAHPSYMEDIKKAKGEFKASINPKTADYMNLLTGDHFYENSDNKFSVSKISGTDWHLVSVYKNINLSYFLIQAFIVMNLMTLSLMILILGLYLVLQKELMKPLNIMLKHIQLNKNNSSYEKMDLVGISEFDQVVSVYNTLLVKYEEKDKQVQSYNSRLKEELKVELGKNLASSKASALNEVFRELSNDFTGPLSVMNIICSSGIKAVREGKLDSIVEYFNTITLNILKISKVILKLNLLSRNIEAENYSQQSLETLLNQIKDIYSFKFQDAGIKFDCIYDPSQMFECKEGAFLQAIISLLNNSYDSIRGTKDAWIKLEVEVTKGLLVKIKISDSGLPIEKEIVEKMMMPGFSTKKGRNGLGLTISKSIVNSHNGEIKYDDKALNATFLIMVPLKQAKTFGNELLKPDKAS